LAYVDDVNLINDDTRIIERMACVLLNYLLAVNREKLSIWK
jgi:hypothetical protein